MAAVPNSRPPQRGRISMELIVTGSPSIHVSMKYNIFRNTVLLFQKMKYRQCVDEDTPLPPDNEWVTTADGYEIGLRNPMILFTNRSVESVNVLSENEHLLTQEPFPAELSDMSLDDNDAGLYFLITTQENKIVFESNLNRGDILMDDYIMSDTNKLLLSRRAVSITMSHYYRLLIRHRRTTQMIQSQVPQTSASISSSSGSNNSSRNSNRRKRQLNVVSGGVAGGIGGNINADELSSDDDDSNNGDPYRAHRPKKAHLLSSAITENAVLARDRTIAIQANEIYRMAQKEESQARGWYFSLNFWPFQ